MSTTRIAFIGAGDVANRRAAAIAARTDAELAGLWTIDREQATPKSETFGCRAYASAEQAFGNASVDVVFVLTPLETHHDHAKRALQAGKHVLVEKAVARHADKIRDLRDAAASQGVVCVPGHIAHAEDIHLGLRQSERNDEDQ